MAATALAALARSALRHDPAARRLPRHRHLRHRRHDPARHAQLGSAHRRLAGAHAHRQAARAASFDTPLAFNLWFLCLLRGARRALVYWALERILRSPWGRVLKAIREDETAAVALGKSARRFRLEAFVLGCTLMGLAGALYVGFIGFVSPFDFLPILTFQVWAMLIVGGSGNNRGALLGALVVWAIWTRSRHRRHQAACRRARGAGRARSR